MMCETCREELELQVGQSRLPDDLRAHLASCSDCRNYWQTLSGFAAQLADDAQFHPTETERMMIESIVRHRVRVIEPVLPTAAGWLRYAAVAAVVVMVAGVGWIGQRGNWFTYDNVRSDSMQIAQAVVDTNNPAKGSSRILDLIDLGPVELPSLDDTDISSGADEILDSLSSEEIQYLEKYLDAKGLL